MRFILLAMLVTTAAQDATADGAGAPRRPGTPRSATVDLGGGLSWYTAMVPEVTTADSLWLLSDLANQGERHLRVDWKLDEARLRVLLTAKGKDPIARPLRINAGLQKLTFNGVAKPKESVLSFRVDLRAVFGVLEPGDYEVQLLLPEAGYTISGLPGFKPRNLESPKCQFQVVDVDIEATRRAKDKNLPEITHAQKPLPNGEGVAGTITNTLSWPITLFLAAGEDGKKQPIRASIGWSRWHPKYFWFPGAAPEADEKRPTYRLAPGETVKVILPDALLDGDGIYAFWLHCRVGLDPKTAAFAQIYSQPFVVDQARPPAGK